MAEAIFTFPHKFLWGSATASHQVEGNNTNNNWYAWENDGNIINGEKSGSACEWWSGRWREDFDRAAETGQNAHRLSIEWSRIQPTPDKWDEDALDNYRLMLRGLQERGITPLVTLHHFTDPLWLSDIGGWENDLVVDFFKDYTLKVVESLHELVNIWCTINEPNIYVISGYLLGDFPPGKKKIRDAYKVIQNMIKAHASAYQIIRNFQPGAKVGLAYNYRGFTPTNKYSPFDRLMANTISKAFNQTFPMAIHTGMLKFLGTKKSYPEVKGTQDYLGLNYYTRDYIAFSPLSPKNFFMKNQLDPEVEQSGTGFIANEPEIFYQALNWANKFGIPIYVTENGIEDAEDALRPKYLIQHIHKMWQGVNFNWPIRGYFHWTLVDNFEWERGWTQRFGLWSLDIETQTRKKRRSASLYEAICKGNSLSSDMVSEYAQDLYDVLFPG